MALIYFIITFVIICKDKHTLVRESKKWQKITLALLIADKVILVFYYVVSIFYELFDYYYYYSDGWFLVLVYDFVLTVDGVCLLMYVKRITEAYVLNNPGMPGAQASRYAEYGLPPPVA
jgi:hypothetical protein